MDISSDQIVISEYYSYSVFSVMQMALLRLPYQTVLYRGKIQIGLSVQSYQIIDCTVRVPLWQNQLREFWYFHP